MNSQVYMDRCYRGLPVKDQVYMTLGYFDPGIMASEVQHTFDFSDVVLVPDFAGTITREAIRAIDQRSIL